MIEVTGNLWTYGPCDVRVITTNGYVKSNGEAVMGRGCALEAKQRWPELPRALGEHLSRLNNIPFMVPDWVGISNLVTFPVKHHWREKADPELIRTSALILSAWADLYDWHVVVMPRPGCGNGGLRWTDVRKVLIHILDDRFHAITWR